MELSKPFHRKKIVVIFLACILIFSGLSARVVYLMVFRAAHYSELAWICIRESAKQGKARENFRPERDRAGG